MPAGRPCKYESHVQPRLMEIGQWARDGFYEQDIYAKLGIGKDAWIGYKRQYTELNEILKDGFLADIKVENTAFLMATSGKFPIMTMWWLQNRQSKKWTNKQVIDQNIDFKDKGMESILSAMKERKVDVE
jgi:hypothetical protein